MAKSSIRFVTFPELREKHGIPYTRVRIHQLEREGRFPRHVKLGDGPTARNAWIEGEIEDFKRARVAERDARLAAEREAG